MNGKFLLDTNIVVRLLNGDAVIENRMENADEPFLSVVALGELLFGAYKSQAVRKNTLRIRKLAERVTGLVCDESTANEFGLIKNALRAKGRPIPENDVWIAAQARQHRLTLVTRDNHFNAVDGLQIERW